MKPSVFRVLGLLVFASAAWPAKAGESDSVFDASLVHACRIEASTRDWKRIHEDSLGEGECVPCVFSLDGKRIEGTELRRRGEASRLLVTEKPNLKVRFPRGRLLRGLRHLGLDGLEMDPSQMAESLAYEVYREVGVAAPRESHARVELALDGGSPALLGLFSLEEIVDARFLEERFGDGRGRLYRLRHTFEDPFASPPPESLGPVPFPFEARDPGDDGAFLQTLRLVAETPAELLRNEVRARVDMGEVLEFVAVEGVIGELDGFLAEMDHLRPWHNNACFYVDPTRGRLRPIAWDRDASFRADPSWSVLRKLGRSKLTAWVLDDAEARAEYLARCRGVLEGPFAPARLLARIEEVRAEILPCVKEDRNRSYTLDEFEAGCRRLREYVRTRSEAVRAELVAAGKTGVDGPTKEAR